MNNLENVLIGAANEAGKFLRKQAFNFDKVEMKGINDPVTQADKDTEELIRNYVRDYFPNSSFIGEEGKPDIRGNDVWILDPIDGTKSFVKGIYDSAISIGVEQYASTSENGMSSILTHGCVYDFMRDIMYLGINGNRKILYRGEEVEISEARKGLFSKKEILVNNGAKGLCKKFETLVPDVKFKNQEGSIALALAHTAFGIYDGIFMDNCDKGSQWDVAAGYYLIQCENDFKVFNSNSEENKYWQYKEPREGFMAVKRELGEELALTLKRGKCQ